MDGPFYEFSSVRLSGKSRDHLFDIFLGVVCVRTPLLIYVCNDFTKKKPFTSVDQKQVHAPCRVISPYSSFQLYFLNESSRRFKLSPMFHFKYLSMVRRTHYNDIVHTLFFRYIIYQKFWTEKISTISNPKFFPPKCSKLVPRFFPLQTFSADFFWLNCDLNSLKKTFLG